MKTIDDLALEYEAEKGESAVSVFTNERWTKEFTEWLAEKLIQELGIGIRPWGL